MHERKWTQAEMRGKRGLSGSEGRCGRVKKRGETGGGGRTKFMAQEVAKRRSRVQKAGGGRVNSMVQKLGVGGSKTGECAGWGGTCQTRSARQQNTPMQPRRTALGPAQGRPRRKPATTPMPMQPRHTALGPAQGRPQRKHTDRPQDAQRTCRRPEGFPRPRLRRYLIIFDPLTFVFDQ